MDDLFAIRFVAVLAVLAMLMPLYDLLVAAHKAYRRRRNNQGGAYGVVMDRTGRVLGTYVDPFGDPTRAARLHGPDSPWAQPEPDGRSTLAWEGFGATEEEARNAAHRIRRLHLQLLPELQELQESDEEGGGGSGVLRSEAPQPPAW